MLTYRIIITTRNEERNIGTLLRSLLDRGALPEDILVIDNFSNDRTRQIAMELGIDAQVYGPERSEQRNYGARIAGRSALLFLDADMEVPTGLLEELDLLVRTGHECVIIPERSVGTGYLARGKAFERDIVRGDLSIEAARLYSVSLFQRCRGFDGALIGGEDWLLARRAYELCSPSYASRAILHHEGRLAARELMRKYVQYGRGYYRIYRKDPALFTEHANPVRPGLTRNWRALLRRPGDTAAMLIYKTLTYTAGFIGFVAEALGVKRRRQAE